MVEKTFAEFVTSERKSQILPHMPPVRRKFVHDLASVYRMDTQMVDQEPKRSVELIRRIDTRIPTPTLSSTVASTPSASHSLGRLTDLRAPAALRLGVAGRSPNTSPAPSSSSASGSRAWTSIVAKAPTPAPPPTAPKLVGGASVSTSWRNNVNVAARAREVSLPRKVAATSSRLIQLPAPIPTPTPPAVISVPEIDVPDSWEDEA
ncbi:hypothetical protein EUX98_g1616 [Antrodiella citrinella]|uniref:R3H domain-containing protein n=1 Tax=Antrodiella citrinella TaxID=2447956 RepID=A0A4S4N106_9APHY|nr:hypothetical protein EUX98_g1616 [Antrodiella citrinella]